MMKRENHIMLKLASDPKNVAHLETFVERVREQYRLSTEVHGNLLISLTEAVNNAIIHGNRRDISKSVKIRLNKEKDKIAIQVSDEGGGFDYHNIPDPTKPGNLLKIGGRGVFLMRELCDEVHFHNNGSTVEIKFKI